MAARGRNSASTRAETEDTSVKLLILDQTGHTETAVDMTSEAAIAEAEHLIREHQQQGAAVFVDRELLDKGAKLPATARETIITPALQGG